MDAKDRFLWNFLEFPYEVKSKDRLNTVIFSSKQILSFINFGIYQVFESHHYINEIISLSHGGLLDKQTKQTQPCR